MTHKWLPCHCRLCCHKCLLALISCVAWQSFKGPRSLELMDNEEGSTGRKQLPISGAVAEDEEDVETSQPEFAPPAGACLSGLLQGPAHSRSPLSCAADSRMQLVLTWILHVPACESSAERWQLQPLPA